MLDNHKCSDEALDCVFYGLFAERDRCETSESLDLALLERCMAAIDERTLLVDTMASYDAHWNPNQLPPELAVRNEPQTSVIPLAKSRRPRAVTSRRLFPVVKISLVVVPMVVAAVYALSVLRGPYLYLLGAPSSLGPLLYVTAMLCLALSGWYIAKKVGILSPPTRTQSSANSSASSQLSIAVPFSDPFFRR